MEQLYQERLARYTTAMRNEKPDRVPVRPFAAEFITHLSGYTCQEVTHDYEKAFDATCKCAAEFDWDATVGNMVYVWTALTETIGLRYYGVPGLNVPPDTGFQYLEPPEGEAWMKPDEYDALIEDPTGFLFNVWLPRVSRDIVAPGEPATYRSHMALLKGGMAMLQYFGALGAQGERLKQETGTVSAIAGIFKAPLDILGDKLRGYMGLTMDLIEQPDKVLAACEALMPHLCAVASASADPECNVPIGFWMHRGCVPFVSYEQFDRFYWPTLKPIIEELWKEGHQTLFYAEGDWNAHLDSFAELPDASIVYHVDRADIFEAHAKLGHKFCLSGGIPNYLLAYGTPEEVTAHCKKVIEGVAADGGYVLDASAIMQNDSKVENVRAMTEAARQFGVYSDGHSRYARPVPENAGGVDGLQNAGRATRIPPNTTVPWNEKRAEYGKMTGDEAIQKTVWEQIDALGYTFAWHCLVSF